MKDRNEQTRDGEPLHDRGIVERDEVEELDEMESDPPIDESDNGPAPAMKPGSVGNAKDK